MKKLNKVLFGFGSVAAVVAPVAAVVACGDNNEGTKKTTIKDANAFVEFAKGKGYVVSSAVAQDVLSKIGANAEVLATLQGKLNDDYHGKDDYAFIIKGAKAQKKATFAVNAMPTSYSLLETEGKGTINAFEGKSTPQLDAVASSLKSRWGLTEENTKDATAIIYLQAGKLPGATTTIEVVEVEKTTDGKIVTNDGGHLTKTVKTV